MSLFRRMTGGDAKEHPTEKKAEKRDYGSLPAIAGDTWFNGGPLTPGDYEGKVVLAIFWTFGCINCRRTIPYLKPWWEKYKDQGLVMVGIHSPEFSYEKDPVRVQAAIAEFGITWPVVLDNEYMNWRNFKNHYWPAEYLADRKGTIVYVHVGEGDYAQTESFIQGLLA